MEQGHALDETRLLEKTAEDAAIEEVGRDTPGTEGADPAETVADGESAPVEATEDAIPEAGDEAIVETDAADPVEQSAVESDADEEGATADAEDDASRV